MDKWDKYFLLIAEEAAQLSKDPSTKCGAVIVDSMKRILSTGFNGFPRHLDDDPKLYADREVKYRRVVHAEMNAVVFARRELLGCTLYTIPFLPCERCAPIIIQAGIRRIVAPWIDLDSPLALRHNTKEVIELFREARVQIEFER